MNLTGKGGIKKGEVRNPKGKPSGKQNYSDRMAYLLEKHSAQGIQALVEDKKQFGKLSSYDAAIVMRIYESMEKGGLQSLNALLDRIIGKPIQPVAAKVEHNHNIALNGIGSELQSLSAEALKDIKSIISSHAIDAEYEEIGPAKNLDDIL